MRYTTHPHMCREWNLVVDVSRFVNSQKMSELRSKDLVDAFQDNQSDLESGASSPDEDCLDSDEEVGLGSEPGK